MKDTNKQPQDNTSSPSDSSGDNRWDNAAFDDMENWKNVFVDDGDAEDKLPEFFDTNLVHKNRQKKDQCQLCGHSFNNLTKMISKEDKRFYCKHCGRSVCDACSQNMRKLSKMDKKPHKICDFCDHSISNAMFKQTLKGEIESKIQQQEEVKTYVNKLQSKLINLQEITTELTRKKDKFESEMQKKQANIQHQLENEEKKKEQLSKKNGDLDLELEDLDEQIRQAELMLNRSTANHGEMIKKKENIRSMIGERDEEIKSSQEFLNKAQAQDYDTVFVEPVVETGEIDEIDRKDWGEKDSSQTSQESDDDTSMQLKSPPTASFLRLDDKPRNNTLSKVSSGRNGFDEDD